MGRFKNIAIEGLLIDDFGIHFMDAINNVKKESKLSEREFLKKIAPKFEELLEGYEETVTTLYLKHHKFKLDSFLKKHFFNQQKITEANEASFTEFIIYVHICSNVFDKIIDKIRRKRIDAVLKTNIALYGLIVRRAQIIVDMLLSGYIDGAMIIWRSMYENVIVLMTLALENSNDLANAYYQHSLRHSKKKIASYNANYKALKFSALPSSTERKLKVQLEEIESRHGKEFLDSEYGWADCLFPGKQKASFRLLEEKVEMQKLRPFYLSCCDHVHPTFGGLNQFMAGNRVILNRILNQEIDLHYFIDPMQFTIFILHEVNDYILFEFSKEEEFNANSLLLEKVFQKLQKTFAESTRPRTKTKRAVK